MKAVGIKALTNELSRYLQLVRQGEIVLVLDGDQVVAEIRQPTTAASVGADRWELALSQLEAEGSIRRPSNPDGTLGSLLGRRPQVPDAASLVAGSRDDRR